MRKNSISGVVNARPVGTSLRAKGAARVSIAALTVGMLATGFGPDAARAAQSTLSEKSSEIAQQSETRTYDIPAGPLAAALNRFADESGLQLVYGAEATAGKNTQGVSGTFTANDALERLLAGSGLLYSFTNGTTVTLSMPGDGATVLSPITVEGQGLPRQAEIGNLPEPYAGGQVARGGKLGMLGNKDMMDTPFNQTSYTSKLIKDQQAKSIGDILESDPSVASASPDSGGSQAYFIRGFYVGYDTESSVNGLYGIFPGNTSIGAETYERIEVLKGPSALLNGLSPTGRFGGSINLVPKRAGDAPLIQFTPEYTSDTQYGGHLDVGRRFGKNKEFGIRVNGVYRDGDQGIERLTQERQLASAALDYQGQMVRLSADFGYHRLDTDVLRRTVALKSGVGVPDAPDASHNWGQPWSFQQNDILNGQARAEVDISDNLTAYVTGGGAVNEQIFEADVMTIQDLQGSLSGSGVALRRRDEARTIETGIRGELETGFVSHGFALVGSSYWSSARLQNATGSITSNLYNDSFVDQPNFGNLKDPGDGRKVSEDHFTGFAFADTLSVLDDDIQLTLGARWQRVIADTFSSSTGLQSAAYDEEAVSPAVALVIKPANDISVYANYIEGLSEGSTAPNTAANAGEILAPKVTKQGEIGVKFDTGELGLTLSAFQMTEPNTYTDSTTNVFGENGEQRNRGIEFMAFGKVTEDVRVTGGVTYIDSDLIDTDGGLNEGNRPKAVPPFRANLQGEWDTPFVPNLTLTGNVAYSSHSFMDEANTQEVDSWMRFDLGARYTIERSGWKPIVVRAVIKNVANTAYWTATQAGLALSDPRTFQLSTTFDF